MLRTHPAMPRMCASRSTNQRKPTPCTRPRTINRRAWMLVSVIIVETLLATSCVRPGAPFLAFFARSGDFSRPRSPAYTFSYSHKETQQAASLRIPLIGLRPRQIRAFRRIHFDLLAFVDERWNLHHQPGLGLRGLGHAGSGGTLQSRLSLNHREDDGLRQLDPDRFAVEKLDLDFKIRNEIFDRVAQDLSRQVSLLVVRDVHKIVAISVGVEELHLHLVHVDLLDGIGRTETVLEHGASAQVAQFGLDKGAQVAGCAVFHAENGVQIIVVLDDHARTELGGRDRHRLKTLLFTIAVCGAGERRAGHSSTVRWLKSYLTLRPAGKENGQGTPQMGKGHQGNTRTGGLYVIPPCC